MVMKLNMIEQLYDTSYNFEGLDFILKHVVDSEQFDVIYSVNDKKYQVGYVRLRWGKLTCAFPDVGGKIIYEKYFDDAFQGCFESEEQRQQQLHLIALEIVDNLLPTFKFKESTNV